jgi:hypothetical protein
LTKEKKYLLDEIETAKIIVGDEHLSKAVALKYNQAIASM